MRRPLPWAVALLGLALVVGGVALYVAGDQPVDLGWSSATPAPAPPDAYQSRLELTFSGGAEVLWTQPSTIGAGLALLGLLVLAALAGWAVGVRSSRHRPG